jgi:cold shock CspA family protein
MSIEPPVPRTLPLTLRKNASSTSTNGFSVTSMVRQMNRRGLWAWLRDYGADREPIPKPGDFAWRRSRQTRPKGEADRDPLCPGDNQISPFGGHLGYGFIERASGGKDVFVLISALERSGIAGLGEGQQVIAYVVEGRKGLEATRVRLV